MASASRLRRQSDPRVTMNISVLVELTPRTSRSALAGRRRRAVVAWRLGWRGGQHLALSERSRWRGETRLDREYDELGPVPRGEFHHCSADVCPHGRRAYHQLRRNLIVRPAGGD